MKNDPDKDFLIILNYSMHLDDFELTVPYSLLYKGKNLYRESAIRNFTSLGDNLFQMQVLDKKEYTLLVSLNQNELSYYECSYESASQKRHCEHLVSALFYLRDKTNNSLSDLYLKDQLGSTAQSFLNTANSREINDFIADQLSQDLSFRNVFLANFSASCPANRNFYNQLLNSVFDAYCKSRYQNSQDLEKLSDNIDKILYAAHHLKNNKNFHHTFLLCSEIINGLFNLLNWENNRNDELGILIKEAFDLMQEFSAEDLAPSLRESIIEYCLNGWQNINKEFTEYYAIDSLNTAAHFCRKKKQGDSVLASLLLYSDVYDPHHKKSQIEYTTILNCYGKIAATNFLAKNKQNPVLLKLLIDSKMHEADYDEAKAIAQEGLEKVESSYTLDIESYLIEVLLEIALIEDSALDSFYYGKKLFLLKPNFDKSLYNLLKDTLPTKQRPALIKVLIADLQELPETTSFDKIAKIYWEEELWNEMLHLLKQQASLENLKNLAPVLYPLYPQQLVTLYQQQIFDYAHSASKRSNYQYLVSHLRQLLLLGASQQVVETIIHLKKLYPRKTSLARELDLVF